MSNVDKTLARIAVHGLDSAYDQTKLALEAIQALPTTKIAAVARAQERSIERISEAMSAIDMARAEARAVLKELS